MNFFYDISIVDTETNKPVWIRNGVPSQDARLTMIQQMDMDLHTAQDYLQLADQGKPVVAYHPSRRTVQMTLTAHNAGEAGDAGERKYDVTMFALGVGGGVLDKTLDVGTIEARRFITGNADISREDVEARMAEATYNQGQTIKDRSGDYEFFIRLKRPAEKAQFNPETQYSLTVWYTKTHEPYFAAGPIDDGSLRFNLEEGFGLSTDEVGAFMLLILKGSVRLETRINNVDVTISARVTSE